MIREDGVLTPHCPMCGHVGMAMPNVATAFCTGGDDCPVWTWDPYMTAADILANAGEVKITGTMLCATCATVVDVRDVVWVDVVSSGEDKIAVCEKCFEATR